SQASSWNKLPEKEANDLDSVVLTMLGTLFPVFRYSSSRLARICIANSWRIFRNGRYLDKSN
ncbi:MAG: hypothetical protein SFU25_10305, partial [Candidatus Caenarcaniphilales bacterium]|nr:hypothetical protein [Candidatus Caenarcaniphilales bacterium]